MQGCSLSDSLSGPSECCLFNSEQQSLSHFIPLHHWRARRVGKGRILGSRHITGEFWEGANSAARPLRKFFFQFIIYVLLSE